ncbi:hypothetical protein AB0G15_34650 [Streptosporangium sp. NPDC023825]|uniref:hypothetical protein n=1 Tax=Streptosporangium sp. NPDC023825 TaxID=3154909 RepID=UPI003433D507
MAQTAQTTVALLLFAALTGGTAPAQSGLTPAETRVGTRAAVLAPVAATAPATDGTARGRTAAPNLRACYDGKCNLTLSKAVRFRVSPRFGVTRLSISFDRTSVRVRATGPGVTSQAVLGLRSTGSVNGIGIRVVSLSRGKAVLKLSPRR